MAALAVSSAIATAWLGWWGRGARHAPVVWEESRRAAEETRERPVYPYSVVPGGVYRREDLAEAAARDRVVAAHYAGLRTERLRPVKLENERRAYVSYRIRNAVFWTRRPVRLARGETVLSDGENLVRARCGNRISDVPREPTAAAEPPEPVMDAGIADRKGLGEPLSPGRSRAILDLQPSPLPQELALGLPPSAGHGTPTFSAVEPMPFLPPGGVLGGSTPSAGGSGSAALPDTPAPPEKPAEPPVYYVFEPQTVFQNPGSVPAPSFSGTVPRGAAEQARVAWPFQTKTGLEPLPPKAGPPSGGETPAPPGQPDTPGDPGTPDNPGNPENPPPPVPPPTPPPFDPPPFTPDPPPPPAVPEPGTVLLVLTGLAGAGAARRCRRG